MQRRAVAVMRSRAAALVSRGLARTAGIRRPRADWQFLSSVTYDNSIAVLELDERAATVRILRSGSSEEEGPIFEELHVRELAAAPPEARER
jgi:hypothetical protein